MDHTITLTEFCENIQAALARVEAGEQLTLLRDGKPVARLEPTGAGPVATSNDPIFRLHELAEGGMGTLDNDEIDKIIYGT